MNRELELEAIRELVFQSWKVRDAIMASPCKPQIWEYLEGHGDFYNAINACEEILTEHQISIDPNEQEDAEDE